MPNNYDILKSRFLSIYANVPEPLRKEIIALVDNEPFTWQTAKTEILKDTKNAKIILVHLANMGVIKND